MRTLTGVRCERVWNGRDLHALAEISKCPIADLERSAFRGGSGRAIRVREHVFRTPRWLSDADEIRQISETQDAGIRVVLRRLHAGEASERRCAIADNPSLEAAQLLLMVTSGQSPETDQAAASGTQRLARLGTFLGQGLILGSGTDASRLELSSGSRVSRQGRETYEFTYRLNDRWALVGEYDEYDEYNAGVKWRAYVQEGEKSEKK